MLWISRDPGVVVKEVKTISGARGEHGARVTTTLTTAQVNVPISDDEFRFVAPAGAKEVPTLGGR
jgi:outer membrane lipoprotein-sorting protein